jgi:Putative zinc-finger
MNPTNARHPSGPDCTRLAPLLPQLRQGTLDPAEEAAVRAHLATCAYCQAELATYDRLDEQLRAYVQRFAATAPSADEVVGLAIAQRSSAHPEMDAENHSRPRQGRQSDVITYGENDMDDPSNPYGTYDTTRTVPYPPHSGRQPSHTPRRHLVLATIAAVLIIGLAASLFALFARPSSGPTHDSTPTVAAQPTPTVQPTATPQPTPIATTGIVNFGHPCSTSGYGITDYVQMGDLQVGKVRFSLAYAANELLANLDSSKPYQLPDNLPKPPNPPVNPETSGGNGYLFTICNTSSTTSHVIASVAVRIAAFAPYSGTLNTYMFCDSFYQRPYGVAGGGCGGGLTFDEQLQANFLAKATSGAQVTATQLRTGRTGPTGPTATPLPIGLGPGQMLVIALGVTPPTAPGTYTFAFGLNYDTVISAPISTMEPTLFDSAAVKWNGGNCTKPALLNQIPASDTTGRYVCAP